MIRHLCLTSFQPQGHNLEEWAYSAWPTLTKAGNTESSSDLHLEGVIKT